MQKFILIRGHQGSGKSTFAAQKTAEFQAAYPDAQIVRIENDLLLTNEHGVYRFDSGAFERAVKQGEAAMRAALKQGQRQPQADILIINSNTNQKSSACRHLLKIAQKHGFETEVYRMHNFYPNLHGVSEHEVLAAYLRLNQNRVAGETDVPAVQPISAAQREMLAQMAEFSRRPLPFDETQQTFVTEHYLLHGRRNFTAKTAKRHPGLRVFKYARSVFYENRFDEALLEMRGLVLDAHNRIIIRPFKKVFNYSERAAKNSKYPIDISDGHRVDAVVKINGFLGCCTYVKLPENHPSRGADFDGQVLYSTTGSLDSDFARMTERHCTPYEALFKQYPNHSFLFEITDENDVHIIRERLGETLIGVVDVHSGRQFAERELDEIAARFNAAHPDGSRLHRPETLENISFGELKTLLKTVEHEGFMVFDADTKELLFKLKSPYYLISKFFGRSNEGNLACKLDKRHVDEEFYPLIDHVRAHQAQFNALPELEKIAFIQEFLRDTI